MGKVKETEMLKKEAVTKNKAELKADAKVKEDAVRWVEITKQEKLLAQEKEAIEGRLRLHVTESGEVLFGDLIKAYNKVSGSKIGAINPDKDEKELLEKFINHWKSDELVGKMLIKSSVSLTDLRKCLTTYKQVGISLKKHGLEIKEGISTIQFKHV